MKPAGVPAGWELYTDYDPCCLLYVPTAPQYLPPPLTWTACTAGWEGDAGTGGECRQIAGEGATAPEFGASVENGTVTLMTSTLVNGLLADIVVDADGPVHQALLETDRKNSQCTPSPQDMRDGKYVYQLFHANDFIGGGFLAGNVDEFRPSFIHHFDDILTHSVVAGRLGVLDVDQNDKFNLYEWNQTPRVVRGAQDVGLEYSFAVFAQNALFWSASAQSVERIAVYTDDGGATDLLASADPSHGFADIGGDGTDMAWIEGFGHSGDPIRFDTASWMTSPFTTNPGTIASRRIRSEDPLAMNTSPIKVGCGFAARQNGQNLRIVRLSDGISWLLPNTPGWHWLQVLAVTCDEVFVSVTSATNNIARVRISSLGAGIPAD